MTSSTSTANDSRREPPRGPIRYARFEGILEGRVGDRAALQAVVSEINSTGLIEAELEIEGGRFTLLFEDRPIPGARASAVEQERLLELLTRLIAVSADPETVESTLGCKVVHEDGVVETLLTVNRGELRPLSQVRALDERDVLPLEASGQLTTPLRQLGFKKGLLVGLLLLTGFGLMAWRSGYVDRILSRPAEKLVVNANQFAGLLHVAVSKRWGAYELTLTRGPAYPVDAAAAAQLRKDRESLAEQAALRIVTDGGRLYVQLCDEAGTVLRTGTVELRPLLGDRDGKAVVRLDGHLKGHMIKLALDRGTTRKG
jgi:hypothetical protein